MKKFLLILALLFCCISTVQIQAYSIPVEKVFKDIQADYIYLDELQTLYDKGMIFPDENGNFNPNKLLTREEFVGIAAEFSCKKCIRPDVHYDYIKDFSGTLPFYDITPKGKYFYCIAYEKSGQNIVGYKPGARCQNGITKEGEIPFCPENLINFEEALAIVMSKSGILPRDEYNKKVQEIESGANLPKIGPIFPRFEDQTPYSFYPYFAKARDYELTEYDTNGNKKSYRLIDLENLDRKKQISKQDFLQLAYIALKSSSCIEELDTDIGLQIKIYPKSCSPSTQKDCQLSDLQGEEKEYDFFADAQIPEGDEINDPDGYIWRIYNHKNGNETIIKGKYIDDFSFPTNGKYTIYLTVVTKNGKQSQVSTDINIGDSAFNNLKISATATPLTGTPEVEVDFLGLVSNEKIIKELNWDFGDGSTINNRKTSHIYNEAGKYQATFNVLDKLGKVHQASVNILVFTDTDGDGIPDDEDKCPLVAGTVEFEGCPNDSLDSDEDGIPDLDDECPLQRGTKKTNGCPDGVDSDGDGIFDLDDDCPNKAGPKENNGCPVALGLSLTVLDATCNIDTAEDCAKKSISGTGRTMDFHAIAEMMSKDSIKSYSWKVNGTTINTGKNYEYIDDYRFPTDGYFKIEVEAETMLGAKKSASTTISIKNGLWVSISANPIYGESPLTVAFTSNVASTAGIKSYSWDFGDGKTSTEANPQHTFETVGEYEVQLRVTDIYLETVETTMYISVVAKKDTGRKLLEIDLGDNKELDITDGAKSINFSVEIKKQQKRIKDYFWEIDLNPLENTKEASLSYTFTKIGTYKIGVTVVDVDGNKDYDSVFVTVFKDTDKDGIRDNFDTCPTIAGAMENNGCPVFDDSCTKNEDCPGELVCRNGSCSTPSYKKSCEYEGNSLISGAPVCDTCPCDYNLSFNAELRKCDIIFPAITSLDQKEIYTRGSFYKIK